MVLLSSAATCAQHARHLALATPAPQPVQELPEPLPHKLDNDGTDEVVCLRQPFYSKFVFAGSLTSALMMPS